MKPRIAVVGGGISGLAAAEHLLEMDPRIDVLLLESSDRLGGVLHTSRQNGFLIEAAADNFLTSVPEAVQLCQRVGFEKELIPAEASHRQTFVVHQGQLHPIPRGFQVMAPGCLWPMLSTRLLGWRSKLRLAAEVMQSPRADESDESVAVFVKRHFGNEVYDRLVQPLITGIYGSDPHDLSLRSSLPKFAEMEARHGSLLRAMWAQRKGAAVGGVEGKQGTSPFLAPRDGMSSFVEAIARRLPDESIRLCCPVEEIVPSFDGGWRLMIGRAGANEPVLDVDGVILATSVPQTTRLMSSICPGAANQLAQIRSTNSAVVSLGYRRDQIDHRLDGYGFVVPLAERRCIFSCSFSSSKYAGRAPEDAALLRVFIGGGCQPLLSELCDEDLVQLAHCEVAALLGVRGEPIMNHLSRHRLAMPRYDVGHLERIKDIERRLEKFPGLALAGNVVCGVGIPGCIASGQRAAQRVVAAASRHGAKQRSVLVPV